jgi:hypothetical protein
MKLSSLAKYALTITMGAAMLAACNNNGGSSLAPSGASVGMPGIAHILVRSQPAKLKGTGPYQYISNFDYGSAAGTLSAFDYPKYDAQIGSVSLPFAWGFCTNVLFGTGKKTFWVTVSSSSAGAIDEFRVGGTSPIKTLSFPSGDRPVDCAINPTTGDLVATSRFNGAVVIYKKASGKGTVSQTPLSEAWFAGFDNKGNLYVDGLGATAFTFVELPKGSKSWETLSLSASGCGASCYVGFPGEVQFDGKYITLNNVESQNILGYTCSGTTCTHKRTVSLSGSSYCGTWIANGYVICADDAGAETTIIYKYPAGGIIATLKGSFAEPEGAVQVGR